MLCMHPSALGAVKLSQISWVCPHSTEAEKYFLALAFAAILYGHLSISCPLLIGTTVWKDSELWKKQWCCIGGKEKCINLVSKELIWVKTPLWEDYNDDGGNFLSLAMSLRGLCLVENYLPLHPQEVCHLFYWWNYCLWHYTEWYLLLFINWQWNC